MAWDGVVETLKILAAIITAVLAYLAQAKAAKVDGKVDTLADNVDGKMTKLLKTTQQAAFLAGKAAGIKQEQDDPQCPKEGEQ